MSSLTTQHGRNAGGITPLERREPSMAAPLRINPDAVEVDATEDEDEVIGLACSSCGEDLDLCQPFENDGSILLGACHHCRLIFKISIEPIA